MILCLHLQVIQIWMYFVAGANNETNDRIFSIHENHRWCPSSGLCTSPAGRQGVRSNQCQPVSVETSGSPAPLCSSQSLPLPPLSSPLGRSVNPQHSALVDHSAPVKSLSTPTTGRSARLLQCRCTKGCLECLRLCQIQSPRRSPGRLRSHNLALHSAGLQCL